jgi:hypothetical protein
MATRAKSFCGSRFFLATLALAIIAALGGGLTAILAARSHAATSRRALAFRLDHFQCYRVDPGSAFKPRAVTLVDQFGRSKAVVSQVTTLCAPVRKNRTLVRNRRAHLTCYPIRRRTPAFRARRVTITNQFEKGTRLVVARPIQLCLPSGKSLLPGPSPDQVKGLDHYQCYLVKPLRRLRPRRVLLVDQFGKARPTVLRIVSLCAPVRKNKVLVRNKRDHLVCYQLRSAQSFHPRRVALVNQFGKAQLVVVAPQTLCLPSLKRLIVLPDLTVSIPNARTQVSCPGGGGTCITSRDFTVTNASSVNVTTPFTVLVEADPAQTTTLTVPGLAAGTSLPLTAQLGPDGNCYDPDCTVTVTVDSGNAVAESNEANNTATRTDPG